MNKPELCTMCMNAEQCGATEAKASRMGQRRDGEWGGGVGGRGLLMRTWGLGISWGSMPAGECQGSRIAA